MHGFSFSSGGFTKKRNFQFSFDWVNSFLFFDCKNFKNFKNHFRVDLIWRVSDSRVFAKRPKNHETAKFNLAKINPIKVLWSSIVLILFSVKPVFRIIRIFFKWKAKLLWNYLVSNFPGPKNGFKNFQNGPTSIKR